jgi:uncharacterized repeat protein (TIGR04138 family)
MQELTFEEALEKILARDPRYHRDAYLFVRDALDHTRKLIGKEDPASPGDLGPEARKPRGLDRHVTGPELLEGIRQQALAGFGPMAITVFEEWGVRSCRDFGEIVFNLVEIGQFSKTAEDRRTDFDAGYDFADAFRKPFWPASKLNTDASAIKTNQA